jgi:hypothetical protein
MGISGDYGATEGHDILGFDNGMAFWDILSLVFYYHYHLYERAWR